CGGGRSIVRMNEIDPGDARQHSARISEDAAHGRTAVADMTVTSDDGDDVGGILDDGAEVVIAAADVEEFGLAFGDVARYAANDWGRTFGFLDRIAVLPDAAAGGPRLDLHHAGGGAVTQQRMHVVIECACAVRRQQ